MAEPAPAIAPDEDDRIEQAGRRLIEQFRLHPGFGANDYERLQRDRPDEIDGLIGGADEGLGALADGDYSDDESACLKEERAQNDAEARVLRPDVAAEAPATEPADAAPRAVAAAGDEVRPSLFFCWLCRLPLSARRSGPPIVLKISVPFAAHAQTHAGPPFENRARRSQGGNASQSRGSEGCRYRA
jgi:hypothetical protein